MRFLTEAGSIQDRGVHDIIAVFATFLLCVLAVS